MPPKRSTSSKMVPTVEVPSSSSVKPIQTTTNTTSKLEMPNAGSATEAKLNVAGGNIKASPVTVHGTPEKPKRQGSFEPGTTPVKFYDDEVKKYGRGSQATSKPTSKGFNLRRLAVQLTVLYALVTYFFVCPTDPSHAPAVCKSYTELQEYRDQAVSYVRLYYQPYLNRAKETIDPYYQPYVKAATPHYNRAQRLAQPHLSRGQRIYNKQIRPRVMNAVTHSHKRITPHVDRVSKEYGRIVNPHVNRYSTLASEIYELNIKPSYDEISKEVQKKIDPVYRKTSAYVSPLVSGAYPASQHHFKHTFLPFASSSYSTSQKTYNEQIHPRLLSSWQILLSFLRENVFPAIGRFQSRYISPQLNKIQDRAFAYKAKSVANEKVASLDKELGKEDIKDEIDELLSGIKAETSTYATTVVAITTADVQPTAVDTIDLSDRDDALSKKLLQEESLAQQAVEKRKTIEALHDLYEVEVQKLGETEMTLLADRLTQLRKAALRDIPNRFDVAVKGYKEECDKWVGRLDKYWEKANRDERSTTEDKISDGVLIARKASVKLADQAEELEDEVDAYLRTQTVREITSTEKAFKTVENFVGKAQEELGLGYAYLSDVTHKDWQRYHTLAAIEGQWHHQLFGMRNGTVSHPSLDRSLAVEPVLLGIKAELERLSANVDARLMTSRTTGEKRISGQFVGVADAAQRGYQAVKDAAAAGTDRVGQVVSDASQAVVGGEPTPTDISGTASSYYTEAASTASSVYSDAAGSVASAASDASASAESLYSVAADGVTAAASSVSVFFMPTAIAKALNDATAGLQSGYGEASQSLLSLAGLQASPTNAQQSASSMASQASAYLFDAQNSASSLFASYASEASKTAMSLAGQTASPTNMQGCASSAYAEASASAASYADRVASEISSAAGNAQGAIAKIVGDAYSALLTLPSTDGLPALSDVSATISSQMHQATREAAKAVGLSVTPESYQEHAESLYSQASAVASSLSSSAGAAIPTLPSGDAFFSDASSSIHEATRAAQRAVGMTPSPESPAEHAASAYSRATDSASSLASVASAALPTVAVPAGSDLSNSASSLYGEASASVSSLLDQAGSSIHDATRTVARAVGATPSPEGVVEHAQSIASSVSEAVSSATESMRQRVEL